MVHQKKKNICILSAEQGQSQDKNMFLCILQSPI